MKQFLSPSNELTPLILAYNAIRRPSNRQKFSPAPKKKFPHRHQKVLRKDEARYSFIGFRF